MGNGCSVVGQGGRKCEIQAGSQNQHTTEDGADPNKEVADDVVDIAGIVRMVDVAQCAIVTAWLPKADLSNVMTKDQAHQGMAQLVDRCSDDAGPHDDLIADSSAH